MTSDFPSVSVIMPVKNGERFLAQAIQSVLQQDYHPFELIVVDGQSMDGTGQILQGYPSIRHLLQTTLGIANAYNQGIAAATGAYIAFLSHDDRWAPHKLRTQIGLMQAQPELQYTVTRGRFFLEPGYPYPPGLPQARVQGEPVMQVMETLVARREAFQQVGLFTPELSTAEDVDWFARANDLGVPMAVIDEVLLYKRIHDANTSIYSQENTRNLLVALRASVARKQAIKQRSAPAVYSPAK